MSSSLEYIGGNYYIAGRENGSAYIAELNHAAGQYSPTANAINGPGATHEIINDIEYYDPLGNQLIYVTGKYENNTGLFGALPGPNGTYDAFVGAMGINVLPNGFVIGGNDVVDVPESGLHAEGIEVDYYENTSGDYYVMVSGEYSGDLLNTDWNISVNTSVTNAFVAYLEDMGTSLDCQWVFTFDDALDKGLLEARATSVIYDNTVDRMYAAGEGDADILEELGSGVSLSMNAGSQNIWVVEIDVSAGSGSWIAGGIDGPNYARGIAGHEDQAFPGGYSSTDINLTPVPGSWPVSSTIPLGTSGSSDMFVARIGDFPGVGPGQFFKRDPDPQANTEGDLRPEPEQTEFDVTLIPNPSSGQVRIQLKTPSYEPWKMEVYNATGGLIRQTGNIQPGTDYSTDWSSLPAGLYVVRITQGTYSAVERLVIR